MVKDHVARATLFEQTQTLLLAKRQEVQELVSNRLTALNDAERDCLADGDLRPLTDLVSQLQAIVTETALKSAVSASISYGHKPELTHEKIDALTAEARFAALDARARDDEE